MSKYKKLSHVIYKCDYPIVWVPKYRLRILRGNIKELMDQDILLAGDGTKLRAQNSKKNNYNQKKIDRHLAYIENKLAEYCKALETADGDNKKIIETKIDKQNKHKAQYKAIEK